MDFFKDLLPKCCPPTYPMQGTGPSRKLSNIPYLRPMMVLPVLVGTSGNVTAGTHVKPRRFAVGTAGRAAFEEGMRRLICDPPSRIRGREHEHPRKDRID